MNINKSKNYVVGISVFVIVAVLILSMFTILINTGKSEETLTDTASNRHDWSYLILTDGKCVEAEPVFTDEYTYSFEQENISAVRASMVMNVQKSTDTDYLSLRPIGAGTEVFLDDQLLYSNLNITNRDNNGFLVVPDDYTTNVYGNSMNVNVALPDNYTGKTLTVTTYFNSACEYFVCSSVAFQSRSELFAPSVIGSIIPLVVIVVSAIMALLLCVIFIVGISREKPNYRIFLLVLFFVMLITDNLYSSNLADYCILRDIANLSFLESLYIIPLLFYVATGLTKWRKHLLAGCSGVAFIYYLVYSLIIKNSYLDIPSDNYLVYLIVLAITIILMIVEFFCNKDALKKYISVKYAVSLAAVIAASVVTDSYLSDAPMPHFFSSVFTAAFTFNFQSLVGFLSMIFALMAFIILIETFIEDVLATQKTISVLNERSRYAMQSYKMMLTGENETRAARHEMVHHMNAIAALINEKHTERAVEYINSVTKSLHSLPKMRYCNNLLINSVAGSYVEATHADGIEMTCNINVPESIDIADKDLCVMLENMLDNAIEACHNVENGKKYIDLQINRNGNFLYIACENSCAKPVTFNEENMPVTSKADAENHGYGVAAMKMIAEKYNSILIMESDTEKFSVKTNLNCQN